MTTAVQLLTPREVARTYHVKVSYVYRLAYLHGWRRIKLGKDVYYDLTQVDAALGKD